MNVAGEDGIINKDGLPGSSSDLVDCRSMGFWDNIEEGISSTVGCLVSAGFLTYSSCQGHQSSNRNRCVSFFLERDIAYWLISGVNDLNRRHRFRHPIIVTIEKADACCPLYRGEFDFPYIADVVFGDYEESETGEKQTCFEEWVSSCPPKRIAMDETMLQDAHARYARGTHVNRMLR